MDDEDTGEYGIAPQKIRATNDFSIIKKRPRQVHLIIEEVTIKTCTFAFFVLTSSFFCGLYLMHMARLQDSSYTRNVIDFTLSLLGYYYSSIEKIRIITLHSLYRGNLQSAHA